MGKFRQLNPELWPLIDIILCSYIELIFRGGVSCLPAAFLFAYSKTKTQLNCLDMQRLCFSNPFTSKVRNFKPQTIFCDCTAWFVSDQGGNQNTGFS